MDGRFDVSASDCDWRVSDKMIFTSCAAAHAASLAVTDDQVFPKTWLWKSMFLHNQDCLQDTLKGTFFFLVTKHYSASRSVFELSSHGWHAAASKLWSSTSSSLYCSIPLQQLEMPCQNCCFNCTTGICVQWQLPSLQGDVFAEILVENEDWQLGRVEVILEDILVKRWPKVLRRGVSPCQDFESDSKGWWSCLGTDSTDHWACHEA